MRFSREHAIYYGLAAFSLLLVLALWVAVFALLERERAETIGEARYLTRNLASAFEEHTVRVVSQVDQVVARVKAAYEKDGRKLAPLHLVEEHLRLPEILAVITVADTKGNIVLSSIPGPPANIADREHFRVHVERDSGAPFIGKPILSRVSGKWSLQVTRRLNRPDGSFAGVAGAAIALEYLGEFYQRLDLGKNSVILLIGRDGIVRVRQTSSGFSTGQDIRGRSQALARIEAGEMAGSHIVEVSPFDGMSRVVSYRALKSYPLVVVVAVAEEEALAEFTRRRPLYLAYGLVVALLIFGCALLLGRYVRQQQQSITERKEAERLLRANEERYRYLFEANPMPMWVRDAETGGFLVVNDAAARLYGYSRDEFATMTGLDIRPEEEHAAWQEFTRGRDPRENTFRTWRHRKKDGTLIDVEVVSHGFTYNGCPARLALVNDVTDKLRVEEEIRKLNLELEQRVIERTRQLEATNRELESFAYSVSHDLRAPLRSIDGFSKALLEDYERSLDEEGRDYLRRVRSATQRMSGLIDDLLVLSRVSRLEMRNDEVDLSALAKEIAAELQRQEPERKVTIAVQPSMTARADASLLRIVLQNLLQNAWKFTSRADNARIEVGTTEPGGYFVRDNGVGFDMAYAGKLFGAFQRLHDDAEFPGTGIGLATVQRIIHRHGGEVRAEAEVGKGATIFFTLGAGGPSVLNESPVLQQDRE